MKQKILNQVNKLFKNDGIHDTLLNGVKIYTTSKYDPLSPFIYDVCLILVLQGKKIGHLSQNTLVYDSKNYLVVPTTLPLECETNLDIPNLARQEDMSVSSFHTHFKKVTSHTPLQYIKKIRLNKAKDLIAKHNYQVVDAAYEMGYDSPSQFSRDFKSYFGYPPKDVKPSFEEQSSVIS